MQYTSLMSFVQMDIGLGKTFYVSGYANPKLRSKPMCNVKPTRITLIRNNPEVPFRTGMYYHDKQLRYLVAQTDNGQYISAVENVYVFDTEEEARAWYNQEVQVVADTFQNKVNKVLENLIHGN